VHRLAARRIKQTNLSRFPLVFRSKRASPDSHYAPLVILLGGRGYCNMLIVFVGDDPRELPELKDGRIWQVFPIHFIPISQDA